MLRCGLLSRQVGNEKFGQVKVVVSSRLLSVGAHVCVFRRHDQWGRRRQGCFFLTRPVFSDPLRGWRRRLNFYKGSCRKSKLLLRLWHAAVPQLLDIQPERGELLLETCQSFPISADLTQRVLRVERQKSGQGGVTLVPQLLDQSSKFSGESRNTQRIHFSGPRQKCATYHSYL